MHQMFFLQTSMPEDSERTITKIRGALVDVLIGTSPEVHKNHATWDANECKLLRANILKPLHGTKKAEDVL